MVAKPFLTSPQRQQGTPLLALRAGFATFRTKYMGHEQTPAGVALLPPPAAETAPITTPEPRQTPAKPKADFLKSRLHALDTYRGLIMVALAFNGFGLALTARNHLLMHGPSPFWEAVFFQFSHVEWVG